MTRDLGITFAGGGNRAFYQLGLMERWAELWPRVAAVSACSAGACVAALILSGRAEQAAAYWKARRAHVTRNFDWLALARGERPAPHGPIYRDTMISVAKDGGLERLRSQPFPIRVLVAVPPRRLPLAVSVPLALATYNLEKAARPRMLHPTWGRKIGFEARLHDARDCRTPEELADLVIASSSTPPFTPVGRYGGERLLDGGMIDNAPAFALDEHDQVDKQLVLLTRPYPAGVAGRTARRLYVAPREPVPVERWDYTRPDLVEATVELGRREADVHRASLDALLAERVTPSATGG